MSKSKVAILKTSPATVLDDTHRVMNLAGYRDVLPRDKDTALKINISWHFFMPASSTTPWQLDGVIRALKRDGYEPDRAECVSCGRCFASCPRQHALEKARNDG